MQLTKVEEVYKKSDTMAKDIELEGKINQKLEASEGKRNAQIQALLFRLRNHVRFSFLLDFFLDVLCLDQLNVECRLSFTLHIR